MGAFPMYGPETTHSRYIGIQQKYQIPMYPKKEYIGTPQNHAIPMYLNFQPLKTPSSSIRLSNPRCHIIPSEADLRANHSEACLRGNMLRGDASNIAGN